MLQAILLRRSVSLTQGKEERRALPDSRVCPHQSTMAMNNPPHRSQPDAMSRKILLQVQALKRSKQPVVLFHVKTGAVVAHKINLVLVLRNAAELDP